MSVCTDAVFFCYAPERLLGLSVNGGSGGCRVFTGEGKGNVKNSVLVYGSRNVCLVVCHRCISSAAKFSLCRKVIDKFV